MNCCETCKYWEYVGSAKGNVNTAIGLCMKEVKISPSLSIGTFWYDSCGEHTNTNPQH